MRFRKARRYALEPPTVAGRKLFVHSDQLTSSGRANKIDHNTGLTTHSQIDRSAAYGAVLDQRLLRLGSIDLEWKNFTAMRTSDVCFNDELHFVAI